MIDEWRHKAGDTTAATCRGRGQALADWSAGGYTWLWQLKTRNQPLISVLSRADFTVRYLSAYLFVPVDKHAWLSLMSDVKTIFLTSRGTVDWNLLLSFLGFDVCIHFVVNLTFRYIFVLYFSFNFLDSLLTLLFHHFHFDLKFLCSLAFLILSFFSLVALLESRFMFLTLP
jgi:hypothetical protein